MMLTTQTAAAAHDHITLRQLSDAESYLPAAGRLSDAASAAQDIANGLTPDATKRWALDQVIAGNLPTAPTQPTATPAPEAKAANNRHSAAAHHCRSCWNGTADYPGGLCADCDSER